MKQIMLTGRVYSLNAQCITDNVLRFIDVEARWAGSTHDSFILNNSSTKVFFENTLTSTVKGVILGDIGYPIKKWLMTPYLVSNTPNQQGFNKTHKIRKHARQLKGHLG